MAGNIDHRNNIMSQWNSGDKAGALAYMKSYFDGVAAGDAGHLPALLSMYNKAMSSKLQVDIDAYNTYVASFLNGVGYPFSIDVINAYGQKYLNGTYYITQVVTNTGIVAPATNPAATPISTSTSTSTTTAPTSGATTSTPTTATTAKTTTSGANTPTKSNALPIVIGVLFVAGIIGLVIYKMKHKKK
jgi:hypothetical protein